MEEQKVYQFRIHEEEIKATKSELSQIGEKSESMKFWDRNWK